MSGSLEYKILRLANCDGYTINPFNAYGLSKELLEASKMQKIGLIKLERIKPDCWNYVITNAGYTKLITVYKDLYVEHLEGLVFHNKQKIEKYSAHKHLNTDETMQRILQSAKELYEKFTTDLKEINHERV